MVKRMHHNEFTAIIARDGKRYIRYQWSGLEDRREDAQRGLRPDPQQDVVMLS